MASAFAEVFTQIEDWAAGTQQDAVDILREVAVEGAENMREIVHEKETDWGRARVKGEVPGKKNPGPREFAGRIEDGDMIADIDHSEVEDVGDNSYEVRWGWADPEAYYMYQEDGTRKIDAMDSLDATHAIAEDTLRGRLNQLGMKNA